MRPLKPVEIRLAQLACVYLALVLAALALERIVGWSAGGVLFVLGAAAILLSVTYVRFGSESRLKVERPEDAFLPRVRRDHSMVAERQREIGVGMTLFAFGLALWAAILLVARA